MNGISFYGIFESGGTFFAFDFWMSMQNALQLFPTIPLEAMGLYSIIRKIINLFEI
jgi:hypothetical protein